MSIFQALGAPWTDVWAAIIGTVVIFAAVILSTRILGLRSFAKMSAFDFAGTVATGTIVASVALASAPLAVGLVALVTLFTVQGVVAVLRRRSRFSDVVDNSPVLLMDGSTVLEDNMRRCQVTADDLRAKLREANVISLEQVRAVVLEATGDVSVLHAPPDGPPLADELLNDVARNAEERDQPL